MIAARQKIMALAALTLGSFFAPIRSAALLSHSAPLASSQSALDQSSLAAVLTLSDAAVSGMCRNDPVNNFDPLGLETAYENYYEPLGWFGRFEYGVLNLASFGTLAKNDRLVARMERGEISAGQWRSASFGNGAVAIGELGVMVGTGGGSTIANGARIGLAAGLTDVLGTRANYSGHAIAYEQSVPGDAAQVALAVAAFSLAGHANSIYQGPAVGTILDPVAVQEYAGWVPEGALRRARRTISIYQPKILSQPDLSPAELAYLRRQFAIKRRAIERAAARGELVWSPGTDAIRVADVQQGYRAEVAARFKRMYGVDVDPAQWLRLNADHPVDLIVGGSPTQRLRMLDESINKSVGASLLHAGRRAGLSAGEAVDAVEFLAR